MCVASCGEGDAAEADLVECSGQGDCGPQEQRRHLGRGVPAMLHRLGVFTCNGICTLGTHGRGILDGREGDIEVRRLCICNCF